MKKSSPSILFGGLVLGFACVLGCSGCSSTQTPSPQASTPPTTMVRPAEAVQPAPPPTGAYPVMAPYFPPPDKMDLCGEPVPLEHQQVMERFDREFTLVLYNHAQVYLWLKRMDRYFPWIEERLRHHNLPDDLKYVAIVESDLQPNVASPKGAAGPWQFMPRTGSSYGLHQDGSVDKRYDFEKSTESAFLLLADLYRRYGNWALAIAAYNCGDKRILDESRAQGVKDYYHLKLPLETERYVFRILAVKAVLSNPVQYGYNFQRGQGYGELKIDRVRVNFTSSVSIQTIASAAGTTYREFRRLNPVFRADEIPPGSYEIKLPAGTGRVFEQNFQQQAAVQAPAPASTEASARPADEPKIKASPKPQPLKARSRVPAETYHTVRSGDTLSSMAKYYQVSVQDIRKTNNLKDDKVVPGQKLRIP